MAQLPAETDFRRAVALRRLVPALLVFLLAAPAAHASSVAIEGDTLTYTAAAGEKNYLKLYESGGYYVIEDRGTAAISATGTSCSVYLNRYVFCERTRVDAVHVLAGDGDDTLRAENGVVEEVECGAGSDSVTADADDLVAQDCYPDPPPVEEPPAEDPPADEKDPAPAAITVSEAPVTMDARGNVPVEVACPATAADGCVGQVTLSMPTAGVAMARRSARVLGRSRRFKLAAGQSRVVPVRLSRRSARIIKTRGGKRRRVKLNVTVEVTTATGTEAVTSTITVTMRRSARPRRNR